MATMIEIKGLQQLVDKLRKMSAKARQDSEAVVAVGYTAAYAIFVHENMNPKTLGMNVPRPKKGGGGASTMTDKQRKAFFAKMRSGEIEDKRPAGLGHYWGPADFGPKFLERPARELGRPNGELAIIVAKALQAKQTMASALVAAGLRLQRESQQLVPVEFGNLRASAFTRLE